MRNERWSAYDEAMLRGYADAVTETVTEHVGEPTVVWSIRIPIETVVTVALIVAVWIVRRLRR